MKKLLWIVAALLAASVAAALYGLWQYQQALAKPLALTGPQTLEVKAGTHAYRLVKSLRSDGWVEQNWPFKLLLKLEPGLGQIKAGCYAVDEGMTMKALLADMAAGKEQSFKVTLVEGERFKDWQARLAALAHLDFRLSGADSQAVAKALGLPLVEGQLMPDTYQYRCGDTDLSLLTQAKDAMSRYLEQAWPNRDPGLPLATPAQALTLASIVEKETAVPAERPLIASVFVNRLNKGMRLQTDPTVIYGLGDDFDGNLTRAHLRQATAYNTYVIKGLPPGPIAMPSRAAIDAVLHPDKADYLYFVAKGDGSHAFSKTLREHNNAVNRYQRGRG
ncbi:endolytic transglycosylase MltG [Gallaecimonas xiamenensis]|uniref:Endolytic murein transglycosylase n=1 Tax=Gallaecimonas xiamenensis 3-C-1 TaxID=745411 RepID=K2K471_9GAMM|nr:endolytic transglycosylase MltG [Gallaecimonas xiamenensis]EKE72205.1 aminodeoxychorismate lyase [Gallaecimonas xiamenensis 3-C-1]